MSYMQNNKNDSKKCRVNSRKRVFKIVFKVLEYLLTIIQLIQEIIKFFR